MSGDALNKGDFPEAKTGERAELDWIGRENIAPSRLFSFLTELYVAYATGYIIFRKPNVRLYLQQQRGQL